MKNAVWLEKQGYFDILKYRRPHDSKGEHAFINRVLLKEFKNNGHKYRVDGAGNHIVIVGDNLEPSVMFSCHTDTVHNRMIPGLTQRLKIHNDCEVTSIQKECLGADDATGIFLMFMLMRKQVPGLYIFHRGEERGGIGSQFIAENWQFSNIKQAIAFDRASDHHIITHQAGGRCASDEYAISLAEQLNKHCASEFQKAPWQPNNGGTFTDTKNYTRLVPECTNLSVGYYQQHSMSEWQDLDFLVKMAKGIHKINWSKLVIARDPLANDYDAHFDLAGKITEYTRRYGNKPDVVSPDFVQKNASAIAKWFTDEGYVEEELKEEINYMSASSNTRTSLSPVEIQRKNL